MKFIKGVLCAWITLLFTGLIAIVLIQGSKLLLQIFGEPVAWIVICFIVMGIIGGILSVTSEVKE